MTVEIRDGSPSSDDLVPLAASSEEEDLNLRIVRPLIAYLRQSQGSTVLSDIGREAGLSLQDLEAEECWVSHARFETLLRSARARLESDQEFVRACQYDLARQYGLLFLVLRYASLRTAFEQLDRTRELVTHISRFHIKRGMAPNTIHLRYTSKRRESRLMCLSRQAQWRQTPTTLWGLPPAIVEEESCIGWGDDCCRYTVRWREPFRWKPALLAGGLGGLAGAGLWLAGLSVWFLPVLGMTGVVAGLLLAFHKSEADKRRLNDAESRELERFVDKHQQASRALLEFHHRQQRWTDQLEGQIKERTAALESVVEQLRQVRLQDQSTLRDISHDLCNPLTSITANASMMKLMLDRGEPAERMTTALADIESSGQQLTQMLMELAERARSGMAPEDSRLQVEAVETSDFVEHCWRQLQALVLGRDLHISAHSTPGAPASILTDRLTLARVLDNLLTNAAKYTERGSIAVEASGSEAELCLKISDTGRGMSPRQLEAVFHGTRPDANPLVGRSSGLGLSVVIRLVDRIGGRLEVWSRRNLGTTFWLYVPTQPRERSAPPSESSPEDIICRVLSIRPSKDD